MINGDQLVHACQSVIKHLLILTDKGHFLERTEFHDGCEKESFIPLIKEKFKDEKFELLYLDKSTNTYKPEISEYFEDAMDRHANTVIMEDFGLRSNALYLGVNIVLLIIDEAYSNNL